MSWFNKIKNKFSGQCSSSCSGCHSQCSEGEKVSTQKEQGEGLSRRKALGLLTAGSAAGVAAAATAQSEAAETMSLKWQEWFKGQYRLMTKEEQKASIQRLIRLAELKQQGSPHIRSTDAQEGVLFGYAFNISKCEGYQECVQACVEENNQDRESDMQYIRIFEMENGSLDLEKGKADYFHEVPAAGHFYLGTQCFQCENPPCVDVCPVGATWKENDGIVTIDYDWCVGCRYCEAACPYWGRRFNWTEPEVPKEEINQEQHYLGNRMRKKGVMEKCTFCVQRSRSGKLPACVEACPTGARIFGNLLDPKSEIRYVLENKKVFRLKEDLGTEPKFWYFMD